MHRRTVGIALSLALCASVACSSSDAPGDASDVAPVGDAWDALVTMDALDARATADAVSGSDVSDAATTDVASDAAPTDSARPDGASPDVADAGARCASCAAYAAPAMGMPIGNAAITEASGIVASRAHPGVYYVHNDSGDSARFFALTAQGETLGEFRLMGAGATDWEDIAIGPCPSGTCVYLGDIGDNLEARASYDVYRVPEPDVAIGAPAGTVTVTFERFPFVYPDGSHNAETMMVHPGTGRIYVVTKVATGASVVFRSPSALTPGARSTFERVAGLTIPAGGNLLATGGDIDPCGTRFLLRTYSSLYEYRAPDGMPFESAFAATPRSVPVAAEGQGEAVAYQGDGRGYVTVSEGSAQRISASGCAP